MCFCKYISSTAGCPECSGFPKPKNEDNNKINHSTIEQLTQLLTVTWDGNLIGKSRRDDLVKCGYAARIDGYNYITPEGIKVLVNLGILKQ